MHVNFNVLRKKLIHDYNNVMDSLNRSICSDIDMDRIVLPVNDISIDLERLRMDIITIGAIEDQSIEDCSSVLTDGIEVKQFNGNL